MFGGDLTPATDLYALGLVAFEMLTGRPSEHMRLVGLHQPILLPEGVADRQLTAVIQRLLMEEPADRYPSAAAVVRDLMSAPTQLPRRRSTVPPRSDTEVPRWAAVLGAVALGAALAYIAWPEPPPAAPPPTVDTSRLGTLVQPAAAPDVSEPIEPPVDVGSVVRELPQGCGRDAPFTGMGTLSDGRSWPVVVPRGYDPMKRHAVLLLFHEAGEVPTDFLRYSGFVEFADLNSMVIIAASGEYMDPWAGSLDKHLRSIEATRDELCLDPDRVYVMGNGAGGQAAERIPCEMKVRAIVNSGERNVPRERASCEAQVPTMFFGHVEDAYNPIEGGTGCIGDTKISWTARQKYWRDFNGCQGKGAEYLEYKGSICTTWSCDEPVVACLIDAGRRWPGTHARLWDLGGCDGPPPDFDYVKTIGAFFKENTPNQYLGPQPITTAPP